MATNIFLESFHVVSEILDEKGGRGDVEQTFPSTFLANTAVLSLLLVSSLLTPWLRQK